MRDILCGLFTIDLPEDFGIVYLEGYQIILFAVIAGAILLGLMIWGGASAVRVFFLRKSKLEDFPEDAEFELPPLTELHAVVTRKPLNAFIKIKSAHWFYRTKNSSIFQWIEKV